MLNLSQFLFLSHFLLSIGVGHPHPQSSHTKPLRISVSKEDLQGITNCIPTRASPTIQPRQGGNFFRNCPKIVPKIPPELLTIILPKILTGIIPKISLQILQKISSRISFGNYFRKSSMDPCRNSSVNLSSNFSGNKSRNCTENSSSICSDNFYINFSGSTSRKQHLGVPPKIPQYIPTGIASEISLNTLEIFSRNFSEIRREVLPKIPPGIYPETPMEIFPEIP